MTEEEINAKLSDEPVQKTGFKFSGVMGGRLVDYGIMSSSSSGDEADHTKVKEGEVLSREEIRRESKLLQSSDDDY